MPVLDREILESIDALAKAACRVKQERDLLLRELRSVCDELENTWKLIGQVKPNYAAARARKLIVKL